MKTSNGDGKAVVLETRVVCGSGGGPDKTILNTPRFLAGTVYRTLCAYMHPPGDPGFAALREKARAWGAPLLGVPDRGPWDWRVIPEMLRICRQEQVTIWHGHDYKSNALGLLLKRFWPMRLVTTVHGWVHQTRRTPLYYWLDRVCLPRYELVICVSEDLRQRCLACGVPPTRCVLVENGIDTTEFRRRSSLQESKARFGVPAGRSVIGAVGRLSPEKGFDVLLRAVARLRQQGADLELWIIGEGTDRPRLEALIADMAAQPWARLLGYRTDLRELYQSMDVFALSSYREGLPNVLLEAMALEVPVVATQIAGIPQLVQQGENGLLVAPGDIDGLAQAIGQLLADREQAKQLRQAGRRTVETRFSFAVRMRKIRALYDALLRTPQASPLARCSYTEPVPGPAALC